MLPPTISPTRPWPYGSGRRMPIRAGGRPWAGVSRLIAAVLRGYRARRDARHLLALSDHLLRDIGLTRGEVARAVRAGCDRP